VAEEDTYQLSLLQSQKGAWARLSDGRGGREPTVQQRSWLLNKIRTDIAMMATKLNAQVIIIKNHADLVRDEGAACERAGVGSAGGRAWVVEGIGAFRNRVKKVGRA
jgi:hypothetical protein